MLADRARFSDNFEAIQKRKLEMTEQSFALKQKRLKFDQECLSSKMDIEHERLSLPANPAT